MSTSFNSELKGAVKDILSSNKQIQVKVGTVFLIADNTIGIVNYLLDWGYPVLVQRNKLWDNEAVMRILDPTMKLCLSGSIIMDLDPDPE